MMGFVSSRWSGAFPLAAQLSVIWLACSIFIPFGFPWVGLGWVALALSAALFVRMRSPRSIAQVLSDVEAEPLRAAPAKAVRGTGRIFAYVGWLSLCPVFVLAGASDATTNLSACKNGSSSCESSRLTLMETTEVARAEHAREVAGCDYSRLDRSQAHALAGAESARNYAACRDRRGYCDRSRLTPSQAAAIPSAVR